MSNHYLEIQKSAPLQGSVSLYGAKNATLVVMASLILTKGVSRLRNVPFSTDIIHMIELLRGLGARVTIDYGLHQLEIDTTNIHSHEVDPVIMGKMRASILVAGPLLARCKKTRIVLPGGCLIGARPINFHLKSFKELGVTLETRNGFLYAQRKKNVEKKKRRVIFDYPSVGATENCMMLAAIIPGETVIVNASLEPEVLDLIEVLKKMGADITIEQGNFISIRGVRSLKSIEHEILSDRLEAGALLCAAAITKGRVHITNARAEYLDIFLEKLRLMGHTIKTKKHEVFFQSTDKPQAVDIKTGPYPAFPTDLQAPFMALLCLAEGMSTIEETVFENRFMHVKELQKMGAQIDVHENKAVIRGVETLYGAEVIASDIRASCALVLAGLAAETVTKVVGINHWKRAYDRLDQKLKHLGGNISFSFNISHSAQNQQKVQQLHV